MGIDLTGITNVNEYYTNHYLSSIFETNVEERKQALVASETTTDKPKTPWSSLRNNARTYYVLHDRYMRSHFTTQTLSDIQKLANEFLKTLGYPAPCPQRITIGKDIEVPVYLEIKKANGSPLLWILLAASSNKDAPILEKNCFFAETLADNGSMHLTDDQLTKTQNEDLDTVDDKLC